MSCCHRNCQDPREARARAHQAAAHLYLQASCQVSGKRRMVWRYCMLVAGWGQTTQMCRMPASITPSNPHPPYHRKIFCKHAPRLTLALSIMWPRQISHEYQTFTVMSRNLKIIWISLFDQEKGGLVRSFASLRCWIKTSTTIGFCADASDIIGDRFDACAQR